MPEEGSDTDRTETSRALPAAWVVNTTRLDRQATDTEHVDDEAMRREARRFGRGDTDWEHHREGVREPSRRSLRRVRAGARAGRLGHRAKGLGGQPGALAFTVCEPRTRSTRKTSTLVARRVRCGTSHQAERPGVGSGRSVSPACDMRFGKSPGSLLGPFCPADPSRRRERSDRWSRVAGVDRRHRTPRARPRPQLRASRESTPLSVPTKSTISIRSTAPSGREATLKSLLSN